MPWLFYKPKPLRSMGKGMKPVVESESIPAQTTSPQRRKKRRASDTPTPEAPLRHGFTTGTAASAATAAAVCLLHGAALGSHVAVALPPFDAQGTPTGVYDVPLAGGVVLRAGPGPSAESLGALLQQAGVCPHAIEEGVSETVPCAFQGGGWLPQPYVVCAVARVVKDGGDDPDATHKAGIVACVSKKPFVWQPAACSTAEPCPPEALPEPFPVALPAMVPGVQVLLYAGAGIGRVTLPGLPVAVGEPAVNPVPRQQMSLAAAMACGQFATPDRKSVV